MGLDQYAYRTKDVRAAGAFDIPADLQGEEIAYWRKHPDLHGWLRDLYIAKGGGCVSEIDADGNHTHVGEDFNAGNGVELTRDDLLALREAVEAERLPHTTGFFFGYSMPEDKERTLQFVERALAEIRAGYRVYYSSW